MPPPSLPADRRRWWIMCVAACVAVVIVASTFAATAVLVSGASGRAGDEEDAGRPAPAGNFSFAATFSVTPARGGGGATVVVAMRRVGSMAAVAATHLVCVDRRTRAIYVVPNNNGGSLPGPDARRDVVVRSYDVAVDDRGTLRAELEAPASPHGAAGSSSSSCTLVVSMT